MSLQKKCGRYENGPGGAGGGKGVTEPSLICTYLSIVGGAESQAQRSLCASLEQRWTSWRKLTTGARSQRRGTNRSCLTIDHELVSEGPGKGGTLPDKEDVLTTHIEVQVQLMSMDKDKPVTDCGKGEFAV